MDRCLLLLRKGHSYVSAKKKWGSPGWPWELELLALVFVATSLVIPYYLEYVEGPPEPEELSIMQRAEQARKQEVASLQQQQGFFWAVAIVGIYVVHLIIASASIEMISTPFIHLFSPLIFSMITYFRLHSIGGGTSGQIVSGTPQEAALWALGVLVITFLVARIRMARHMLRFKDVDWDVSTKALMDGTYLKDLIVTVKPLIYPPRMYRACSEGVLIEGWFYVLPIPFAAIQSVEGIKRIGLAASGEYFATSTKSLVRIQLVEQKTPMYISPADREQFMTYCNQHMTRGVVTLVRDTESGASGTAAGTRGR